MIIIMNTDNHRLFSSVILTLLCFFGNITDYMSCLLIPVEGNAKPDEIDMIWVSIAVCFFLFT